MTAVSFIKARSSLPELLRKKKVLKKLFSFDLYSEGAFKYLLL